MKNVIDVSIVMGVYNAGDPLSVTMESILSQAGVEFEFIIVNDGSQDDSGKILEEYAGRDNRIRIVHQDNQGLTKALIRGCQLARGAYIARQDAGDISLPERLALQKAALDADETLSFVSCWTEYCGPKLEFLYFAKGTGTASTPTRIISEKAKWGVVDGPTHHGSVMFRNDSYIKAGGYRSEFYYGQDWDLWYRLAELGKFHMVENTLYKARVMPDSISSYNKKKQESLAKFSHAALLRRLQRLPDENILKEANNILPTKKNKSSLGRAKGLYFIGECLRKNKDNRSLKYLIQSVQADPCFLKSWLRIIQVKWL